MDKKTIFIQDDELIVGNFAAEPISITSHAPGGAYTGATPDGRYAGETLADGSTSPVQGTDKSGPLAVMQSAMKLPQDKFMATPHNLVESLRIISILIYPFMHTTSDKIREQIGLLDVAPVWEDTFEWKGEGGQKVHKGDAIFPRLDVAKELEELEAMKAEAAAAAAGIKYEPYKEAIEFEDFEKIDLRTGVITKAEKHPKADKLLVFQVDMGSETRQIISGVAEYFKPEECVGQHVMVVANLKPRMLRGLESNGMLLFSDDKKDGKLKFASTASEGGMVVG